MLIRIIGPVVLGLGLALLPTAARAAGGNIAASLKDGSGHVLNGKITATKGTLVKTCQTAAGACTLTGLAAGTWSVVGLSTGGMTAPAVNVAVTDGKTTTVGLKLTQAATPPPPPTTTTVTTTDNLKNVGVGTRKVAEGAIRDAAGHALNGTVTVLRAGTAVGKASTAAGTYRIFDLADGTYVLRFVSAGGQKLEKTVTVKAGAVVVQNFQL